MTDILCRWLNDELNLSQPVDQKTFAREFSSGYLIGEVLNCYQLQNDFHQFSQSRTSDSKLNNFTRLEPVLHLLGIPFDTNMARDIITEKHGVATRIMYQLFIALTNKKKANLTGVAMETMRPAAPAKLNAIESGLYKERLKHITPRQTDLNLEALASHFHDKRIEMEKTAFKERFEEEEQKRNLIQAQRQSLLEKSRDARNKQSEMIAKIHAATVHIPKPPAHKSSHAIAMRKAEIKKREAKDRLIKETTDAICHFEKRMKLILPPSKMIKDDDSSEAMDMEIFSIRADEEGHINIDPVEFIRQRSNDDYIGKIRKRLNEDEAARKEREKRRRKVLVDQLSAHQSQEEARREEMLVNRLMRQSQQERRIAVQLLQVRHEKDVIRKNRMIREQLYEERRLRDFEEAMNKENEMARLAKVEYEDQIKKDQELHDQIAAERAEARYRKHYDSCMETLLHIVDFSSKVAEYRELTNKLLPPKLMREWKSLFIAGQPLYEVTEDAVPPGITPEQVLEEERQKLLDEGDFVEYKNMVGEWQPKETGEITGPPRNNPILGHVIHRLFKLVHPPTPPPEAPKFPAFPIKACVLGKLFSGKSSCIQRLAQEHRLEVLNAESLIDEAIQAFKDGEMEVLSAEFDEELNLTTEGQPVEKLDSPPPTANTESASQSQGTPGSGQTNKEQTTDESVSGVEATPDQATPVSNPPQTGDITSQPATAKSSNELKPVVSAPSEPGLSARAKLGGKAAKCLKRGRPVDDPIVVEIIVEAIRQVPEGTGWILDGYPTNYVQAKLLEKALTGFEAPSRENVTKEKASSGKHEKVPRKNSTLVPDPRPAPPAPEPTSGINVVILLDVPDDTCLKRASGRYQSLQKDEQYHQEFKPPPEGSATGMGKQEKVIPVEDEAHDREQIHNRITGFLDSWSKLEKWFNKFGNLRTLDANQEQETVYLEVEKILEDTLDKLKGPKEEPESIPMESEAKVEEKVEEKPPEVPVEPVEPPKEEPLEERALTKKGSRTGEVQFLLPIQEGEMLGSAKSRSSSKESSARGKSPKSKRGESPKKGDSGKKTPKSRDSSPKSPKRGKSAGKKGKSPEPEPEPELPPEPVGPPPPEPGSDEWEFVDEPLTVELAEILTQHWEIVENTYITNGKFVFRHVREERENIIRYFYQIRKDYLAYLRRPDHKQEFVTQWQKEYNSISDDMRDDEETRSELHQRTDDLRERLWNICDERKEQAELERSNIMSDGWVDDHLGILSNHYITLMQCEVDRFQDTVRLSKDYYRGMEGHIPDQANPKYARLSLIELPVENPKSPEKSPSVSEGAPTPPIPAVDESNTAPKDLTKSPRAKSPKERSRSPKGSSKSRTPSAKRRDKSKEKKDERNLTAADVTAQIKRQKIPLVPRRPLSPDADGKGGAGKGKADKKPTKKDADMSDSPQPPPDLDEKLIHDCYSNAIIALSGIMSKEQSAKDAEEEAEKQKEKERALEMEKAKVTDVKKGGKGGKKGAKSRSPSPKKGKGKEAEVAPTPPPPAASEETEEEKAKRLKKSKMREEYFFAIQEEEIATKARLELIRSIGIGIIQDLKGNADDVYKDMNDWLGARFLKEMESIDHMTEVIRNAIEKRERLKHELILQQQDFLVNEDVFQDLKMLKSPSPIPEPAPVEEPMQDVFTVSQLYNLFKQFMLTAPSGVMSSKSFIDVFENMVAASQGLETLPDAWMNITPTQIQDLCTTLSGETEYVDWRRFLVNLTQPLPYPKQSDLLNTLEKFKDMDQRSTGFVSREQYDQMELWFPTNSPMEPGQKFNRIRELKKVLFDICADHSKDPPGLDYISMLLYFSAASHYREGFYRALSVASGTHMPRPEPLTSSTTAIHESVSALPDDTTREAASVNEEAGELPITKTKSISEEEVSTVDEDIPESANQAEVPIEALYKVLQHGCSSLGDSYRFCKGSDPDESTSMEKLLSVYHELGDETGGPVPFKTLLAHPLIQEVISACQVYKILDVKHYLSQPSTADNVDATSTKTSD